MIFYSAYVTYVWYKTIGCWRMKQNNKYFYKFTTRCQQPMNEFAKHEENEGSVEFS